MTVSGFVFALGMTILIGSSVQSAAADTVDSKNATAKPSPTSDTTDSDQPTLPYTTEYCYGAHSGCTTGCRKFEILQNGNLLPRSCAAKNYCLQSIDPCP